MIRRSFQAEKHSASSTSALGFSWPLFVRFLGRNPSGKSRAGFSLVELLVVMGILGILLVALLPKISSIGSTQSITQAYGAIPDLLRQARAYAMANNTYVYVGIEQGTGTNVDKVYLGVVASKDGTNGINGGSFRAPATNLLPLQRVQIFDGVKIGGTPVSGLDKGVGLASSSTTFSGSLISRTAADVTFQKIIQFRPDGSAYAQDITPTANLQSYIYTTFQPAHGNANNLFTVQVDGLTGAVRAGRKGDIF